MHFDKQNLGKPHPMLGSPFTRLRDHVNVSWVEILFLQIASFMTRLPHCGISKWATLEFLPVCEATPNDHLKPTDSTVLLISYNAKICLFRYC